MAIAPTKSSLLKIRKTLEFAREGYDLLEQKREFLVMELMHFVNRVKILEKEFSIKMRKLRSLHVRALSRGGLVPLWEKGSGVHPEYNLEVRTLTVMGLHLPEVECRQGDVSVPFDGFGSGPALDELAAAFRDLLTTLGELAGVKASVWQLAREVKKTQRRVNALDKIVIPENALLEKFIEDVLDEGERESFFVKKMIRTRKDREAQ